MHEYDCANLDFELPPRFVVFRETQKNPRSCLRILIKIKPLCFVGQSGSARGVEQGGDFVGKFACQIA